MREVLAPKFRRLRQTQFGPQISILGFFALLIGASYFRAMGGFDLTSIIFAAAIILAVGVMSHVGGDLLGLALAALIVLAMVPTL